LAIIGKAPRLGIHTWGWKLYFQNTMPTSYAFSYVVTPLRGIFRDDMKATTIGGGLPPSIMGARQ